MTDKALDDEFKARCWDRLRERTRTHSVNPQAARDMLTEMVYVMLCEDASRATAYAIEALKKESATPPS